LRRVWFERAGRRLATDGGLTGCLAVSPPDSPTPPTSVWLPACLLPASACVCAADHFGCCRSGGVELMRGFAAARGLGLFGLGRGGRGTAS
jgi:hypothetical protein